MKNPNYVEKMERLRKELEDLTFHINWEKRAAFLVEDRKITKLHNDDYRKICSQ